MRRLHPLTAFLILKSHTADVQCSSWSSLGSLSFSLSICPSLYLSISFSPSIVLARWVDTDMHYSSVCPLCHCRAELWAEGCKAEVQSINQGLTLTTMGYVDWMSQDNHANIKVLWAILYTLRLSGTFLHQQQFKFIGILLLSQWNNKTTCFWKDLTALHSNGKDLVKILCEALKKSLYWAHSFEFN